MRAEERAAFEAFVRRDSPALLRTATLLAGSEEAGRDLLQSALIKTLRHWRKVEVPEAYTRRVLATTNVDTHRRQSVAEVPLDDADAPGDAAVDALHDREEALRLIRMLPPAQRAVLVLRFFEDLTERDTAAALGISVGAVKSQTSRGIAALRALTAREDIDS